MSTHFNIIIFIFVFGFTTLWLQLKLLLTTLKNRTPIKVFNDQALLTIIYQKTGYSLRNIYLASSDKLFGMMSGIFTPRLILSQKLYKEFNNDEIEYVILHEMGHFLLKHNFKETLAGVIFSILGIFFIYTTNISLISSIAIGILFGIFMIRLGRQFEYQADSYALSKMTNPTGMITATNKFERAYGTPRNKILEAIFYRGNPFANRIHMANIEISKRKTSTIIFTTPR